MRSHARVWFLSLVCGVLLAGLLPAGASAAPTAFGIEKFVAVNCKVGDRECARSGTAPFKEPAAPDKTASLLEGFLTAGGRVPNGITDFKVNVEGVYPNAVPFGLGKGDPSGIVDHIRTDVAPGLATNPTAVHECSTLSFDGGVKEEEAIPGTGFYARPGKECEEESEIGRNEVIVFDGEGDLPLSGPVFNLAPKETSSPQTNLATQFGVALELPEAFTAAVLKKAFKEKEEKSEPVPSKPIQEFLEEGEYSAHTLINGNVEWGKQARGTNAGDYHDYFEIEVSPQLPLIASRLDFIGTSGSGDFITNATSCPGNNTTTLKLTDLAGTTATETYTPPAGVGLEECSNLKFEPLFALSQSSTLSDQPDSLTTEVSEPYDAKALEQSQVLGASVTLPAGMTLNPSAAAGLQACTPAQARIHGEEYGVACPEGSKIGTVALEVPTLPAGSLTGDVYLGASNEAGTVTGQSAKVGSAAYPLYVVANSAKYGVSVRLKAEAFADETTGQVTTVFDEPPEQPFKKLTLKFERNVLTAVANPLICGSPQGATTFTATAKPTAPQTEAFGTSVTGCAATIPFGLSQGTENESANGGGHTSWTYSLGRPEGSQYLKEVKTVLPEGLVGAIPDVTLCGEPQAGKGECTAASRIGSVTVASGAGSSPYTFNGTAYMTGPYNGAPYGLSIVVPAVAGPFNLGNVVSRATININQTNAQVTSDAVLPTIVKGIPIRLRSLTVNVNRQGFLYNPTNCSTPSTTTSELTSTEGAVQKGLSSSFQLSNCTALSFVPKFTATTSAKTSRANGASLTTTITQAAGQANIKSVKVQLPKQMPSRQSTLKLACLAATFEANPASCPKGSNVGTATVITPTLPGKMTGNAYFVSHGGEAFPDLDLVVEDQGVRIILVGNTDIKAGITTTTFATTPDVPVSSVTVSLPTKSNSAVGAVGDFCLKPLVMPTTITAQNGKVTKQNTIISVSNCGVHIVGHKVVGNTAYLTVRTYAAGRISGSGKGVSTITRSLGAATKAATLKVPLSRTGRGKRKPLKVKLRVGFVPKKKSAHSSASVTVTFR